MLTVLVRFSGPLSTVSFTWRMEPCMVGEKVHHHVRKGTKKMDVVEWLGDPESRGSVDHNRT